LVCQFVVNEPKQMHVPEKALERRLLVRRALKT
jgi:hypothetical protein